MIKQLDKLLMRSFIGPFIVTFAIAIFVLVMQTLWLYLDDIAGKGLGFFLIVELMSYKSVGLVPLALPLALLISSVMVLGGMAEHYELSSFKSAGVSLIRVMRPLIFVGFLGAILSYLCSDFVIPAANVQFGSRMYDIQNKKPTLSLEVGAFNTDFNQFAIHIGKKATNGRDISDVLIYDHTKTNIGQLTQITAASGEMFSDPEGRYFIMRLFDGHQYGESSPSSKQQSNSYPFVRTNFDSYTKVFDLSEFKLKQTSRDLFSQNRSMLATWQLAEAVDSMELNIRERKQILSNHLTNYLSILPRDTLQLRPTPDLPTAEDMARDEMSRRDSMVTQLKKTSLPVLDSAQQKRVEAEAIEKVKSSSQDYQKKLRANPLVAQSTNWPGIDGLLLTQDGNSRLRVLNRARSSARSILTQAESTVRILPGERKNKVKHVYDLHMKYSLAVVCIIFIFIGAPMGAIVRKGGFGYPILVSIVFFVIFIILTISCRKLAESFTLSGELAGWMPCIVLFPISVVLTHVAARDQKILSFDALKTLGLTILRLARKWAPSAS